jgi:NodT family efflux transporter outer membrane factor (OMF) lipoprotein
MRALPVALFALASLAAIAALPSCAVGPDFKAPAPPAATVYVPDQPAATASAGAGGAQRFTPADAPPPRWWESFGSAGLDALVAHALAANPSVHESQARLRAAQADMDATTGATRYPALDASLSAARQRVNTAAFGFTSLPSPGPFDLYNASVNASYSLDLFGANRRSVEAALAQVDYQHFELEASRQTVAANVVTAAIRRAAVDAEIRTTQSLLQAQTEQFEIMQQRLAQGGVSESDLRAQRLLLAQAQAKLPPLIAQREQLTHQLALYTGQAPGAATLEAVELPDLKLPADLPLPLPAALARQRPDVRASEALWRAASAEVGIATANLYPKLTLTASAGSERTAAGQLADSLNVWSLGAQLMQPIFHGGELRARKRSAVGLYDAAAAVYEFTVLTSLQQVADCLTALSADAAALAASTTAADEAQATLAIVQRQYELGGVSHFAVLDAQRQELQTRLDAIAALADRFADTAALFHALGGGDRAAQPAP